MLIPFNSSEHSIETIETNKFVPVTSKVCPLVSSLAYPLGRYFLLPFYFGKIEVSGRSHLPADGPIILAPTHRSRWDAFMVSYAAGCDITGNHLRFMVSANEVKGLQGKFIRRFGGFPVDTKNPSISSLRHGVELLLNKETLVIFPEGNIFQDNKIHRLKPGLARLALQAEANRAGLGVKVVPMNISYDPIVPRFGTDVKISIGTPLNVADYLRSSTKQSARDLMADLQSVLQDLA